MQTLYYILVYLYYDAAIICCICMFYFSIYGGAINNNNNQVENRFIGIGNISPTTSHAQLICRSAIKKLWPFFGPRVVVSTAAFHARVRGLFPGLGGLIEENVSSPSTSKTQYCDREVGCSASDLKGLNCESCVCRAVSSHS